MLKRAFGVDRQDLPPNRGIGIENVADSSDARAVDQPVELPEPSDRFGHERGHLVPIGDVNVGAIDPFAAAEFGHDLIEFRFPNVCGGDRCAFCEQTLDAGGADTAAGAGDQDGFGFKALHLNPPCAGFSRRGCRHRPPWHDPS